MNTLNFKFNEQDINIIILGLGELKLKESGQVYGKIQEQIAEQFKAPHSDHSDKEF